MMGFSKKWMMLTLLILGVLMFSGCTWMISKNSMNGLNDAKASFQKATLAGAKKCAPVQYATAEVYLALAAHEIDEGDDGEFLMKAIKIIKEKSLEAIQVCEKAKPPAPAPVVTPPAPTPPTPPRPPPPPPVQPKPVEQPIPPGPPTPPAKPAELPVLDTIYFDANKTNINPTAAKGLDRNGMILKGNSQLKVEIGGHTDTVGSEQANKEIAEKRAQSAKKYLQDKFNIPENRLMIKSYGATKPIGDNKSKEARSKNRRVEFRIVQ